MIDSFLEILKSICNFGDSIQQMQKCQKHFAFHGDVICQLIVDWMKT